MSLKETFYKEKESCEIPFTHIEDGITDSSLKEIDDLFGAADILSIKHGQNHYKNIRWVSYIAPAIAFLFLLYDEAELHWLILTCLILIMALFYIYNNAKKAKTHDKYLEYRVLAESLRAQYFLSISGVKTRVTDILPWFIKIGIPWIYEVLSDLSIQTHEKKPIINCWIKNQGEYHYKAYLDSMRRKKRNDDIEKIVLIITIIFYFATFAFECYMLFFSPFDVVVANWNRAALKIGIGTMSAITIFLGNYYGKMSLSSKIEEHRRMAMLYEKAEEEIVQKGEETEELIISLAREFLIENTTWYAHQKKNKPDFDVE